jgi:hypothetical protein
VLEELVGAREALALFPPAGTVAENDRWLGLGDLVEHGLFGRLQPEQTDMLQHLQQGICASDQATRERELLAFRDAVVSRAKARGEYDKVPLESYYLAASWHYKALHYFLFALLVVALGLDDAAFEVDVARRDRVHRPCRGCSWSRTSCCAV